MTNALLLGFGAIGRHVVELLRPERDRVLQITAAVRDVAAHESRGNLGTTVMDSTNDDALARALENADLVVEAAGVAATKNFAPAIVKSGKPLVLTSVGALTDPATRKLLTSAPELLHVTNGAIGGFDILGATAEAAGLDTVTITTSKAPSGLIQEWMPDDQVHHLKGLGTHDDPETLFEGGPIEAIEKFPGNVNVAVALAWATRGLVTEDQDDDALMADSLDRVKVKLVADPDISESIHRIHASGAAGTFELYFAGAPSPVNPRTSGQTALSVAHSIRKVLMHI